MKNANFIEKDIINATVDEIVKLFENERERLRLNNLNRVGNRSNNNGGLHKCAYMLYLLGAVDGNTILHIEGCRGDGEIRDFCLANAGSVVEALVKAILDHERAGEYAKAWDKAEQDAVNGCMGWEIKASLDSHYKATPATGNRVTVLVNRSGISVIKKADVQTCVDSHGRLPATGLFGKRNNFMIDFLENALGIAGGFEEI